MLRLKLIRPGKVDFFFFQLFSQGKQHQPLSSDELNMTRDLIWIVDLISRRSATAAHNVSWFNGWNDGGKVSCLGKTTLQQKNSSRESSPGTKPGTSWLSGWCPGDWAIAALLTSHQPLSRFLRSLFIIDYAEVIQPGAVHTCFSNW